MQNWIATVRHMSFRLTQIGVEVSEEYFILVLTQGLPTTYETFVVSLDATDPSLLTSEHVISRLLNEEVGQLALNCDHEFVTSGSEWVRTSENESGVSRDLASAYVLCLRTFVVPNLQRDEGRSLGK